MKVRLLAILALLGGMALAQSTQNSAPASTEPATKAPTTADAKIDPAKEADIRKLMALTGVEQLSGQMVNNLEPGMKASLTQAFPPGEYRAQLVDLFLAKLRGKISVAVVELAVPIYDKYFSDAELRELLTFYETPIGKKTITVMPQLMTELMTSSQQLGQQLGRDSLAEVLAEHPDLKQAMEQAEKASRSH
jgi:uncharacterized protein